MEKVIKGLEHCRNNQHVNDCNDCHYGGSSGMFCYRLIDESIALLKEQEKLIKAMKRDLDLVRSCKVCANWTECTPDAPPESEEFKTWRDCGGSCKLNWIWRGI